VVKNPRKKSKVFLTIMNNAKESYLQIVNVLRLEFVQIFYDKAIMIASELPESPINSLEGVVGCGALVFDTSTSRNPGQVQH